MACLGVLFSLDKTVVSKLKSFESDEERLDFLQMEIEEEMMANEPERFAELDKAWDALHRCLTDGKPGWDNGGFSLNHAVMGGECLYFQQDYIMSLKTPEKVHQIANAVGEVSKEDLRRGYDKIDSGDYGFDLTDDDFEYTWEWFQNTVEFWKKAANEQRFVLFTVDQ